jgi:hypothetical protein
LSDSVFSLFPFLGSRIASGPKIAQPVAQSYSLINGLAFARA